LSISLFFFNDTATTEIYTLSLHDALPICTPRLAFGSPCASASSLSAIRCGDRKSTRLNSSHITISYAVFCLKKKKGKQGGHTCTALKQSARTRAGHHNIH